MNNSILSIIDIELRKYRRTEDDQITFLDQEDVFLKHESGGIRVITNGPLGQGASIRLQLMLPYIGQSIIKHVPIRSGIIFCLGDTIKASYEKSFPVLCFSKSIDSNAILIPNIDFFTKSLYRDLIVSSKDIEYIDKKDSSIFIGASTGNFHNNTRIKYGLLCKNNKNHHSYLSFLCQNTDDEWIAKYPGVQQLLHKPISIEEQLQNKIVVNIDGNTVCWSRLYWQMNSNSIPVYIEESNTQIQFFDHIDKSECYIKCDLNDSLTTYDSILNTHNTEKIITIINNGKNYCKNLFNDYLKNPDLYLQSILDTILNQFFNK